MFPNFWWVYSAITFFLLYLLYTWVFMWSQCCCVDLKVMITFMLTAILANLISLVPDPLRLPLIGSSLPPSQEEHKPQLACQPIISSALFEAIGRTCVCVCVHMGWFWHEPCLFYLYRVCWFLCIACLFSCMLMSL